MLAALLSMPAALADASGQAVPHSAAQVSVTVEVASSLSVSTEGEAQSGQPIALWISDGGRTVTYSVIDG